MRLFALVMILMGAAGAAQAVFPIPAALNYQGLLEDSLGVPVPDGDYEITFRLYRFPNDSVILHEETAMLGVYGGRFTHYLGWAANFAPDLFDGPLWLSLAIDGGTPLVPRVPIVAVPFAMRAERADATTYADSAGTVGIDVAGAASATRTTTVSFSGPTFYETILSESIQVPRAGLVLVIATCELGASGFGDMNCELGVSASSSSLPPNQDINIVIDSSELSTQSIPVTVHGLFQVEFPGNYTYYFLGRERQNGLDNYATNVQMTLVFLPAMYGAVNPTSLLGGNP